jgi:hypothetical protein
MKEFIEVDYQSQWEEGYCDSKAKLNLRTGEVYDIEDSNEGEDFECHERDVIFSADETEVLVEDINGFDYAIDTRDLYLFTSSN